MNWAAILDPKLSPGWLYFGVYVLLQKYGIASFLYDIIFDDDHEWYDTSSHHAEGSEQHEVRE